MIVRASAAVIYGRENARAPPQSKSAVNSGEFSGLRCFYNGIGIGSADTQPPPAHRTKSGKIERNSAYGKCFDDFSCEFRCKNNVIRFENSENTRLRVEAARFALRADVPGQAYRMRRRYIP